MEVNWLEIAFGSLGGVALLMYGIRLMGDGLERAAGNAMRRILAALTRNAWIGCLLGTVITATVQSSSAITVMTVGFVNAQLMTFRQALGVIYGANIGTTITGQIMAFHITDVALPAIAVGFVMHHFARRRVVRDLGQGLLGFGLLFLGLMTLKGSVGTIQESDFAVNMFQQFSGNIILAVIVGCVVTIIIQSSSASLGIAIALAAHNLITLEAAIGLMLGDNIGTCITAQIASIGTNPTARRTAWAHTFHNVVGVILALIMLRYFIPLVLLVSPSSANLSVGTAAYESAVMRQVANSHTLFNVLSALLFLTFNKYFATFLERLFPDRKAVSQVALHIDRRLLANPRVAIGAIHRELGRMAGLCREFVQGCTDVMLGTSREDIDTLRAEEKTLDQLQDAITLYVVELTDSELPDVVSDQVPTILHVTNDLERIGDHCKNLLEIAEEREKEIFDWSDEEIAAINEMTDKVMRMLVLVENAFTGGETNDSAEKILAIEEEIDQRTEEMRGEHLDRAREGVCLLLPGVLFLDALMNYEKMGDHARNVGRALRDGITAVAARV